MTTAQDSRVSAARARLAFARSQAAAAHERAAVVEDQAALFWQRAGDAVREGMHRAAARRHRESAVADRM